MRRFLVPSACLALGAVAWLAASARAADLDKYLPDDAQSVVVVNVKAITSWAPFQKLIQPKLEELVKTNGSLSDMIKETGVDPFHDIERVVVAAGADSYKTIKPPQFSPVVPPNPPPPTVKPGAAVPPTAVAPSPPPSYSMSQSSPIGFPSFVLIQGKFDAEKLTAAAQKQLKDHPETMKKPRTIGGIDLWEATQGSGDHVYMALLDKGTLMATPVEGQALEAIDKANGKRQTDLKDKQIRDAVAKLDAKAALQVAASGDLVTEVAMKSDGKGGSTTTTHTLRDGGLNSPGVEGYHASVTLGDADMHGEAALTFKDADKAKEMAKKANDGLEMSIKSLTTVAQQNKDLQPLVDAMKTVKITDSGATVTVEGTTSVEAVEAAVKAWFMVAPKPPAPPAKPLPPADPAPKKDK